MPNALTEIAVKAAKPPARGTATLSGLFPAELRLSHQSQGHEILCGLNRERQTANDRPLPGHLARRGAPWRQSASLLRRRSARRPSRRSRLPMCSPFFLPNSEKRHKSRTARDYKRLLLKHLRSLSKAELGKISTRDIAHITDKLHDVPSEAAHALVAIKVFFNWCVRRGYVAVNPCARLTTPKSSPRERVLTEAEIKSVYRQAEAFPYPFGAIVRLLVLTGQRRGEIGLIQWKWIDEVNRTITFPWEATKNNRSHTFPFGPMAAEIFGSLPRTGDYVFPATREFRNGVPVRVVNGWSKLKTRFDKGFGRCRTLDAA